VKQKSKIRRRKKNSKIHMISSFSFSLSVFDYFRKSPRTTNNYEIPCQKVA
jgi:hypothetical protein